MKRYIKLVIGALAVIVPLWVLISVLTGMWWVVPLAIIFSMYILVICMWVCD